jgi:hypothetical protein
MWKEVVGVTDICSSSSNLCFFGCRIVVVGIKEDVEGGGRSDGVTSVVADDDVDEEAEADDAERAAALANVERGGEEEIC